MEHKCPPYKWREIRRYSRAGSSKFIYKNKPVPIQRYTVVVKECIFCGARISVRKFSEKGAGTAEDIALPIGISRSEVISELQNYERQGLVEVIVNL